MNNILVSRYYKNGIEKKIGEIVLHFFSFLRNYVTRFTAFILSREERCCISRNDNRTVKMIKSIHV